MENTVKIEFTSTIDKTIYENSMWSTKEAFFEEVILIHIDNDLKRFKRESERSNQKEKQEYDVLIQTVENMKQSILNSITYEVVDLQENRESIKIGFTFKHYDTHIMSVERVIENFIFNTPIQDLKTTAQSFETMKAIPGRVPESEKQKVDGAIILFESAVDFMEDAKSNLTVTVNGIELKNIFTELNKKQIQLKAEELANKAIIDSHDISQQVKLFYKNGQSINEIEFGKVFATQCAKLTMGLINKKSITDDVTEIMNNMHKNLKLLNQSEQNIGLSGFEDLVIKNMPKMIEEIHEKQLNKPKR